MPADLPGRVIHAVAEGQRRLDQPQHPQEVSEPAAPAPLPVRPAGGFGAGKHAVAVIVLPAQETLQRGQGRVQQGLITGMVMARQLPRLGVGFGTEFGRIGQGQRIGPDGFRIDDFTLQGGQRRPQQRQHGQRHQLVELSAQVFCPGMEYARRLREAPPQVGVEPVADAVAEIRHADQGQFQPHRRPLAGDFPVQDVGRQAGIEPGRETPGIRIPVVVDDDEDIGNAVLHGLAPGTGTVKQDALQVRAVGFLQGCADQAAGIRHRAVALLRDTVDQCLWYVLTGHSGKDLQRQPVMERSPVRGAGADTGKPGLKRSLPAFHPPCHDQPGQQEQGGEHVPGDHRHQGRAGLPGKQAGGQDKQVGIAPGGNQPVQGIGRPPQEDREPGHP